METNSSSIDLSTPIIFNGNANPAETATETTMSKTSASTKSTFAKKFKTSPKTAPAKSKAQVGDGGATLAHVFPKPTKKATLAPVVKALTVPVVGLATAPITIAGVPSTPIPTAAEVAAPAPVEAPTPAPAKKTSPVEALASALKMALETADLAGDVKTAAEDALAAYASWRTPVSASGRNFGTRVSDEDVLAFLRDKKATAPSTAMKQLRLAGIAIGTSRFPRLWETYRGTSAQA